MSHQYTTIKNDVPHLFLSLDCPAIPENAQLLDYNPDFYEQLLSSLGFNPEAPPLAQVFEGDYIVTPVSFEATHNNAFIRAQGKALDVSPAWYEALAGFLAEAGLYLEYHNEGTWLLKVHPDTPVLQAKPVSHMMNLPLIDILPKLDKTHFWQRLHTEIQMFFNTHPLQNERIGKWPVNGVWIWGGGALQPVHHPKIITDKTWLPIAKKLAVQVDIWGDIRLDKKTVVLLNTLPAIQTESYWFFKDCAFYLPPSSLWKRLKERIFPCK